MRTSLSIKKELYDLAKKYAKQTGRKFSGLVEIGLIKFMNLDEFQTAYDLEKRGSNV